MAGRLPGAGGRPGLVAGVALAALAAFPAGSASAEGATPGRAVISQVVTYKCRPENRPAFRSHLEGPALARLAAWRRDGRFVEHLVLFNVDVNEDAWDALLLLRFESWSQYARWKEVERDHPAVMDAAGLRLTSSISSAMSDLAWEKGGPPGVRPTGTPVYFVRPYYFQDRALYRGFFEAYNAPQLDAWVRVGAVTSYRVLMNQHPTGGTWGVLFIYEYPGWEAANARDDVKDAVGPELGRLPGWNVLGETKGAIRTSGRVTLAERIGAAGASGR